jgi:hypothetical protein
MQMDRSDGSLMLLVMIEGEASRSQPSAQFRPNGVV